MADLTLKAERRQRLGTAACNHLRAQKKIPCVLYGHGGESVSIAVEHDNMVRVLEQHVRTFDVDLDGKVEHAFVKQVAYNIFGTDVLHVDLVRIAKGEKMQVKVPLRLFGHAQGVADGGLIEQPLVEVQVECPVESIPNEIRVDVSAMGIGSLFRVSDLQVPAGVTILTDPGSVVVAVREAREIEGAAAAPPEAGAVEPELIREKKPEEKEEEKAKE